MRKTLLIWASAVALSPPGSTLAEQQQPWSERTPPPVKFAPPAAEQKHDWSGVYVGVNGGMAVPKSGRGSGMAGVLELPK